MILFQDGRVNLVKKMKNKIYKNIQDHYLEFGAYTNPGLYKKILKNDLPSNVREIGLLVRKQLIHRACLKNGNIGSNKDLRYGDMTKVPWFRQCEDDVFPTASAMLSELYRRDKRGFVKDRAEKDRLVVTCRFVSVLVTSILRLKGIPTRSRAGFANYFFVSNGKSTDHWINQYWDKSQNRWITIDVDGSLEKLPFKTHDIPKGIFDFAADSWLGIREGRIKPDYFHDAVGFEGLITVGWQLFHDFHCLMHNEIIYQQGPAFGWGRMDKLTEKELKEIDVLAELMLDPDKNFEELQIIWNTNKKFRLLKGSLL